MNTYYAINAAQNWYQPSQSISYSQLTLPRSAYHHRYLNTPVSWYFRAAANSRAEPAGLLRCQNIWKTTATQCVYEPRQTRAAHHRANNLPPVEIHLPKNADQFPPPVAVKSCSPSNISFCHPRLEKKADVCPNISSTVLSVREDEAAEQSAICCPFLPTALTYASLHVFRNEMAPSTVYPT